MQEKELACAIVQASSLREVEAAEKRRAAGGLVATECADKKCCVTGCVFLCDFEQKYNAT